MSNTPHELAEEFPGHIALMHDLKVKDRHFSRISDLYHDLNRTIHRVETNVEPRSDFELEDLKKQRLALKDEIAGYLTETA